MTPALNCSVCEHPIGVYEPLIVLAGRTARRTSLAAEPAAADGADALVHRGCLCLLEITHGTPRASASLR